MKIYTGQKWSLSEADEGDMHFVVSHVQGTRVTLRCVVSSKSRSCEKSELRDGAIWRMGWLR